MKSTRILLPSLIFGIAGGFALTGCIEQKQTAAAEPDMLQKTQQCTCRKERNSVMQNQHQLCLSETGIGERFHITAYQ